MDNPHSLAKSQSPNIWQNAKSRLSAWAPLWAPGNGSPALLAFFSRAAEAFLALVSLGTRWGGCDIFENPSVTMGCWNAHWSPGPPVEVGDKGTNQPFSSRGRLLTKKVGEGSGT